VDAQAVLLYHKMQSHAHKCHVIDRFSSARSLHTDPGGGTPYNGLYGDAPLESDTFLGSRYGTGVPFKGKVCERVPIFEI